MLHDVVENTPLLSIRLASVGPAHRVDVSRVLRRQPNVTAPHFDSTGTCRPLCANSGRSHVGWQWLNSTQAEVYERIRGVRRKADLADRL
jgi:hypothetical protein